MDGKGGDVPFDLNVEKGREERHLIALHVKCALSGRRVLGWQRREPREEQLDVRDTRVLAQVQREPRVVVPSRGGKEDTAIVMGGGKLRDGST